MTTYQEFASENLKGFGWDLPAEQIPEFQTCKKVINDIVAWYNSNAERTRRVLDASDISAGLWSQGFFTDWPGLYQCFSNNTVGWFANAYDDIVACLERAKHAVDEQPSDPISDVREVTGESSGPTEQ
jgi:hypothetical protein